MGLWNMLQFPSIEVLGSSLKTYEHLTSGQKGWPSQAQMLMNYALVMKNTIIGSGMIRGWGRPQFRPPGFRY